MNKKPCPNAGMKGQIVFEFVIASLILFSIVFYTIGYVSSSFDFYHFNYISDKMESSALRISGLLLNDPEIGIVGEWPMLSLSKMEDFDDDCSDYPGLLEKLGLKEKSPYIRFRQMNITVTDTDGLNYISCGRTPRDDVGKATVTRFALAPSGKIARIEISVW